MPSHDAFFKTQPRSWARVYVFTLQGRVQSCLVAVYIATNDVVNTRAISSDKDVWNTHRM